MSMDNVLAIVAVKDIRAASGRDSRVLEIRKLLALGVDASERHSNSRANTVMITDPDGNHIAFAEAIDSSLAC